ncbi:uncharacterized protein ACN2A1_006839 [Glossina fuscipes fuscipes]
MSTNYVNENQSEARAEKLQVNVNDNVKIIRSTSSDSYVWKLPDEEAAHRKYHIAPSEERGELVAEGREVTEKQNISSDSLRALDKSYDTAKIRLNLNAEKVSFKSLQHFNRNKKISKTTTTATTTISTIKNSSLPMSPINNSIKTTNLHWKNTKASNDEKSNRQRHMSTPLNFTIVPINLAKERQITVNEEMQKLPEIKLTSFVEDRRTNTFNSSIPQTTKLPLMKAPNKTPKTECTKDRINGNIHIPNRKASLNSELIDQPECSTSPESMLDNVLSAASSFSVHSSSISSNSVLGESENVKIRKAKTDCSPATPPLNTVKHVALNLPAPPSVRLPKNKSNSLLSSSPLTELKANVKKIGENSSEIKIARNLLSVPNLPLSIASSESFETATNCSRTPTSPLPDKSVPTKAAEEIFPEEFKCQMCRGIYQDPRSLNCLHTFCFQCIVNENFKEDVSIPFWSQPNSVQQREPTETKALSTTKANSNSLYSSSPEITSVRSNSDLSTITSKQRHSSFSFKQKKSTDRLTMKSKNRTKQIKDETQCNPDAKRLIICEICQFPTELPLGGIRQLPQNFLLLRKIEELHFKMSEKMLSSIWCSLCCEETSATYHCLNCTVNLCTLCKEAHERQRSTSGHKIQSILELRKKHKQKNTRNDNTRLPLKCIMHPEFEIKFFCVACLQVACTDCLALLHKGHKYETAAKAINHYGKVLKDSAEQTRPLCNYAEHSVEKLNETAKSINRKCDEIKTQVELFVNSYFEAIEVHRNTLLQQVHRARESKVEMILEQQMSLEKRAQDASMAIQFTQELTEMTSDVEILSFLKILLQRFEYCQQFKAPIDPKISDSLHFLPKIQAPSTKSQNDIPMFGIITMQTVEPSLCTLQWDGFSQLRLHKKVELILISRDADGVSLCHGGLEIKVKLKYKEQSIKLLPTDVHDNRDGTYAITFTPDSQGTLLLTVAINDKHIKGSPFTFLARAVRPHSGIYHCCAFCSSKGNKMIKCSCEGRMPGYNDGCGHGHTGHPGRRHWSCCGNVLENSECTVANKLLNPST